MRSRAISLVKGREGGRKGRREGGDFLGALEGGREELKCNL